MTTKETHDETGLIETDTDLGSLRSAISLELERALVDPPRFRVARPRTVCRSASPGPIPIEVLRYCPNWGALLLFTIWALVHGMWRPALYACLAIGVTISVIVYAHGLASVVPGVGMGLIRGTVRDGAGLNGDAWRSGRYASAAHFIAAQTAWARVGGAVWVAGFAYLIGTVVALLHASSAGVCMAR